MAETHKTVCEKDRCTGCMACIDRCPKAAITIQDSLTAYNAVIDLQKCVHCGMCHDICQNNHPLELKQPEKWLQGWAKPEQVRVRSSSGGAAAALARGFIQQGGVVCSCALSEGKFGFQFAKTADETVKFAGSKYVKSNPAGVYRQIEHKLKEGQKVLFIGLPCQVAALKLYLGENNQRNLYTVDLICHGTPSPKLLEDFLAQHNHHLENVSQISFRSKAAFDPVNELTPVASQGGVDSYLLAFLCSLNYTENCYHCSYAGTKRGSDVTIGDSWGTELPLEEQHKGISLLLCQSEKGKELIQNASMALFPVNPELAISCQQQLKTPSPKGKRSFRFFQKYRTGHFEHAVFYSLPQKYVNQKIKELLIKLKLLRPQGVEYAVAIREEE